MSRGTTREGGRGRWDISYFILLFCPSVRWRPARRALPIPLPPTYLALGAPSLDPFSFLPLLHLDLRRKWTFYETEIMARRQSEVRGYPGLVSEEEPNEEIRQKKREFVIICLAVGFVGIAKQTLHEQGNGPFHIASLRPADDTAPSNGDNMTGAAGGTFPAPSPLSFLPPSFPPPAIIRAESR